jgi:hypothetical protein
VIPEPNYQQDGYGSFDAHGGNSGGSMSLDNLVRALADSTLHAGGGRKAVATRRQMLGWLVVAPCLARWMAFPARAEDAAQPSFSRQAYQEAIAVLPMDELTEAARAKIKAVVEQPTIYRRMPVEVIDCDPELYLFLVRYPEIVVNMWQLMGVTRVRVRRTAPYVFEANDGAGTQSTVELVYGNRDKHLWHATGYYEGPLFRRRVNGTCVLLLQSGYSQSAGGRMLISTRLDMFVALENVGAEFVAKTLHPLVGKTADHNFTETVRFVAQVSQQAEINRSGMQRLAERLDNVDANVKRQFAAVVAGVSERTALRVADASQPDKRPEGM